MGHKRIHIIIATTLFAIMLWVSVKLGVPYQTTVSAPLVIKNVPPGSAMKAPLPRTVQLRLRGEGWQLAGLLFGSTLQATVDLASLSPDQGVITIHDIAERMGISGGGVQAVDMKPDSIIVAFDSIAFKKVPVVLQYRSTFRDRHGQVGPIVVTPDSVELVGARSVIASIEDWHTQFAEFTDLKGPVDITVPLQVSERYAIGLSPAEVNVQIDVQWFAEKIIPGLTIDILSVPPHREVILVPPKIDLVVRGGVNQLSGLALEDFRVQVDYSTVISDTTGGLFPDVRIPEGIHLVSRRPERVQYIVRKKL